MTRHALLSVVLTVSLVLSGCSALSDSMRPPAAESPDFPGISDGVLADGDMLLESHRQTLDESGYVADYRIVGNRTGSRGYSWVHSTHVEAWDQRARVTSASNLSNGDSIRVDYWLSEKSGFASRDTGEHQTYEQVAPSPSLRSSTAGHSRISTYLGAGDYRVVDESTRNGQEFVTLSAETYVGNRSLNLPSSENVTNFESTVVVDSAGRIHEMDTTFTVAFDSEESVTLSFEYDLDTETAPTLERPEWVETAEDRLAPIDLDFSLSSNRYIELTHQGGETIPAGSHIAVLHGTDPDRLTLNESLESGETVYVYYPADGSNPVLTRESPGDVEVVELTGRIRISVSDSPLVAGSPNFTIWTTLSSEQNG